MVAGFGGYRALGYKRTLLACLCLSPVIGLAFALSTERDAEQKEKFKRDISWVSDRLSRIVISRTAVLLFTIAAILFICRFDMPYGYYEFVRVSVFVLSVILTVSYYNRIPVFSLILLLNGILFNPIFKISFDRKQWQEIDTFISYGFLLTAVIEVSVNTWRSIKSINHDSKSNLPINVE